MSKLIRYRTVYTCDVCKVAEFDTVHEAEAHELNCKAGPIKKNTNTVDVENAKPNPPNQPQANPINSAQIPKDVVNSKNGGANEKEEEARRHKFLPQRERIPTDRLVDTIAQTSKKLACEENAALGGKKVDGTKITSTSTGERGLESKEGDTDEKTPANPLLGATVYVSSGPYKDLAGTLTTVEERGWWTIDNPRIFKKVKCNLCKIVDDGNIDIEAVKKWYSKGGRSVRRMPAIVKPGFERDGEEEGYLNKTSSDMVGIEDGNDSEDGSSDDCAVDESTYDAKEGAGEVFEPQLLKAPSNQLIIAPKFPVGCPVWYNVRYSVPCSTYLEADSGIVKHVSYDRGKQTWIYEVERKDLEGVKIGLVEGELAFAVKCPVYLRIENCENSGIMEMGGEVINVKHGKEETIYTVLLTDVKGRVRVEEGVVADRLRYQCSLEALQSRIRDTLVTSRKQKGFAIRTNTQHRPLQNKARPMIKMKKRHILPASYSIEDSSDISSSDGETEEEMSPKQHSSNKRKQTFHSDNDRYDSSVPNKSKKKRRRLQPLCSHEGCTTNARKGGVCTRHGIKIVCNHEGCTNVARTGAGFCDRHAALFNAAAHGNDVTPNNDEACVRPKLVSSRLQSDKGFEAWLEDRKTKWRHQRQKRVETTTTKLDAACKGIEQQLQRCDFTDPKSIKAHFGYQSGKGKLRPMLSEIAKLRTYEEKGHYVRVWRNLTKEAQERWKKCRSDANDQEGQLETKKVVQHVLMISNTTVAKSLPVHKQPNQNVTDIAAAVSAVPQGRNLAYQAATTECPVRPAAAAAMARAAAASLKDNKSAEKKKKEDEKDTLLEGEVVIVGGVAGEMKDISEEELKTLGSGDDEDIPAAKRAAMCAGGSQLEPPKSAVEVDFDICDPPEEHVVPPGISAALDSATMMTENDVLCGRGGGTNSQMGNRRFRALVRDFQPTYLMAKRKEKPKMARSAVLIIRNRGGRFLRRDDADGRLFEVGDLKAEAKTRQALREGLDVRATKTAANTLMGTVGEDCKPPKPRPPPRKPETTSTRRTACKVIHHGVPPKPATPSRRPPPPKAGAPVHAPPGYSPARGGGAPPPGYYPYPPHDPYYRSRYPPTAPPPGYHPHYGGSHYPPCGMPILRHPGNMHLGVEKREDGKQHAEDDSKPTVTPSTAVPVEINGQYVDESDGVEKAKQVQHVLMISNTTVAKSSPVHQQPNQNLAYQAATTESLPASFTGAPSGLNPSPRVQCTMIGATPHDNDVLCGRGVPILRHPGNTHLRSIVQAQKPAFLNAKKKEKQIIAMGIVRAIENLDPPGRFLIEDPNSANDNPLILSKVWVCIEREKAVNKVMHRLREKEGATSGREAASASSSSSTASPALGGDGDAIQAALRQQQSLLRSICNMLMNRE